MPVKRNLLKEPLKRDEPLGWHCPTCDGGYLEQKRESFYKWETSESRQANDHDEWEPEWNRYRFTMLLSCNNPLCHEPVVVTGESRIEIFQTAWDSHEAIDYLYPTHVSPSPLLIPIAENYPEEVSAELRLSFVASWSDFSSAGNHIRTAVERLLDHLGVAKESLGKDGWPFRLSLDARISKTPKEISSHLRAIKWIGNQASHSAELTRNDIFNALDIIDTILEHLFNDHGKQVKELVEAINKARGAVLYATQA
jgi:hypothetical protein